METTKKAATKPAVKTAKPAQRFALIVGAAALTKAIGSIKTRGVKLDHDIHVAAVSCIVHSATHNDPDMMTRLIDSLGKSARKQGLIAWTLNYGAFTQDEAGALVYNVKRKEQVLSEANIKAAQDEPFWDYAPEPVYHQFDLNAAIAALLAKAEKALTKKEQDTALVQPDKLAALRAIAGPQETATTPSGE